ncbi:MAG: transposase [Flavobacteriaceae bacterium]|nr:transposase [Flavobacteriaceae bacterium]
MAKFNNKYRIASARLKNWDYSNRGVYYITICTANRECFFGTVTNDEMIYSEIGQIVEKEWIKTLEIRPDMNLELGEFVVMPNHFHGVLFIGNNEYNSINDHNENINEFGPQSKNLSSIIRGFKSAVTVQAKRINPDFGWQARFYDHIIRNPQSYDVISKYIIDNPKKWIDDEFNK